MPHRCATAVLLSSAALSHAGVVTLGASQDNTLYESSLGNISNGAGQYCFAGKTASAAIRRAVIRFEVQGALPAGAVVVDARLRLHMSKSIGGVADVSVHRALSPWGEGTSDASDEEGSGAPAAVGDATWLFNDYPTYYWGQSGGDFAAAPSATTPVGDIGVYTWGESGAADVAGWVNGSTPNYGWVLVGDESASVTTKRFDTRENPVGSNRPALTIYYRPACVADWNSDGAVNTNDVLGYLNEWASGAPSADLNGSGDVNTLDMLAFLNAWNAGC